jgi:beta-phosphoglucomutase-like phosphatase (HAD superfamily)
MVRAILCDADGTLFPSEEPAFEASTEVTNGLAAAMGLATRFDAHSLRIATTGMNFRSLAVQMRDGRSRWGTPTRHLGDRELEKWIAAEKTAVTEHLRYALRPDPAVQDALSALSERFELAVVSSSALSRLAGCLEATALTGCFAAEHRFSAEDSLPRPISKPDPAIYRHALAQLGLNSEQTIAIEDSVPGAASAVAAGCQTIGNLSFVASAEREDRRRDLEQIGVMALTTSWSETENLLMRRVPPVPTRSSPRASWSGSTG